MGVKGLYSYLRAYRHPIDVNTLTQPCRIGVDGLSMLYKFRGDVEAILRALEPFKARGYSFVFVFDGKAPEFKAKEVEARKEKRTAALEHATALQEFLNSQDSQDVLDERSRAALERKIQGLQIGTAWHVSREARRAAKHTLWLAGIPSIKAIAEADDLLLALWREGKISQIVSTDMDFLVAGVQTLWIPSAHQWEEVFLMDVLRGEGVTLKGFQDAAILCGMDSGSTLARLEPQRSFALLHHYGSLEVIEYRLPQIWNFETYRSYVTNLRARFRDEKKPLELTAEKHREILESL